MCGNRRCRYLRGLEPLENRWVPTANLLLDYNTEPQGLEMAHAVEFREELFFVVNPGADEDLQLWKTDGTRQGSTLVEAISMHGQLVATDMAVFEDKLLIQAASSDIRRDGAPSTAYLFSSNGAPDGAELLEDFSGAILSSMDVVGDYVYFNAYEWYPSIQGLFRTDGTVEGTEYVIDDDYNRLFATNTDTTFLGTANPNSIWVSDESGLRLVRELAPHHDANIDELVMFDDALFFTAETTLGNELWTSDGTFEGTGLLRDLNTGPASSNPTSLTLMGDSLYFLADDGVAGSQLWKLEVDDDGAEEPYVVSRLTNIPSIAALNPRHRSLSPPSLVTSDASLLFLQRAENGFHVWSSDGRAGGERNLGFVAGEESRLTLTEFGVVVEVVRGEVAEFSIVAGSSLASFGEGEVVATSNEVFYFVASEQVWRSDGSAEGTVAVGNIGTDANGFSMLRGDLFFSALRNDEQGLWRSNHAGTSLVKEINTGNGSTDILSFGGTSLTLRHGYYANPRWAPDSFSDVFFVEGTEITPLTGQQFVWSTSGPWHHLYEVGDAYYFSTKERQEEPFQIWRTDGTPRGTSVSSLEEIQAIDDRFILDDYLGLDIEHRPVDPSIPPPSRYFEFDGHSRWLTVTDHGSYFLVPKLYSTAGGSPTYQSRLYRVEGESAVLIASTPVSESDDSTLLNLGETLYFVAGDPEHGVEIWGSDGTSDGTKIAFDINVGEQRSSPYFEMYLDDALLITADDGIHGREIWSIQKGRDPILHEVVPGAASTWPVRWLRQLSRDIIGYVGNSVYFVADDGIHGRELWEISSDGTTNTFDINAGAVGADPQVNRHIAASGRQFRFGDTLLFTADDGITGREVWQLKSDGVELFADIHPGPRSSDPQFVSTLEEMVLITANDGTHGRELWQLTKTISVPVAGDVNGDRSVDFEDFLVLSAYFGSTTNDGLRAGDLDGDGRVDFGDFLQLSQIIAAGRHGSNV